MKRTVLHPLFIRLMLMLMIVSMPILTAGCGSAPEQKIHDLDADIPGRWVSPAVREGDAPAAWWSSFESASLDSLVHLSLERNHDLEAAAANLAAAAASARIAGADVWPGLDLSFQAARAKNNYIGLPIPGSEGGVLSNTSNSRGVSLTSSWEVDLWGRVRSGRSAANADFEAAEADFAGARLSLAAQTARVYFALLEGAEQMELAEETVRSYRVTVKSVRARFERGTRSSLDLRLALASLANAEALLELRREQLDRTVRQLEVLVGAYPSGEGPSVVSLPGIPEPVPSGLPAELLARRPDLIAAERRLAATGARVRQAKASLLPAISLTASGGRSSNSVDDLLDGDFSVWSLAGNILQPIFHGGKLRAGVHRAEAGADAALASYAAAALRAFGEVESALAAESSLAAREAALRRAADQATAARFLAEERYRSGLAGMTTLLEAQRQSLSAESQWIETRRRRLDVRIDLHVALGGGFVDEELLRLSHTPNQTEESEADRR